jgi:metal-dependent amidase/aminoacylase/carboxypeptidase family protein
MNTTVVSITRLKDQVQATIEEQSGAFVRLAHDIHAHPELAFAEHYAAARITDVLADEGFGIRREVFGLPTAFVASVGEGPLHIAFCAEYDALDDGIGHGCGHNLIAGAAVAAAVGLLGLANDVGLTVSVIGTPGEELIGLKEPPAGHLVEGKIALLEAGVFDDVHAALMVHPGATPYSEFIPSVAGQRLRAQFSTPAAGGRGLGPAEAQALARTLRRALLPLQVPPYFCRVEPAGESPGARADLLMAASCSGDLVPVLTQVRHCIEEAARTAGVSVEITEFVPVAELRNDPLLAAAYRKNAEALGRARELDGSIKEELRDLRNAFLKRTLRDPRNLGKMIALATHPSVGLFLDEAPVNVRYGTDLGNVSQVIPAIHPMIGIGGTAPNNTSAFTPQADTDEAYRAMLDGGVALAWTALDAATDPEVRSYLLRSASARVGSWAGSGGTKSAAAGGSVK